MKTRSTISILSALAIAAIATAHDAGTANARPASPDTVPPPAKISAALAYANTDSSTGFPILTANDMFTWMNWFSTGDPRANCDQSTVQPLLTANDLQCFLNVWVEALVAQEAIKPNP